ncbi:MAG: transposase [Planctomycetota bacterium]
MHRTRSPREREIRRLLSQQERSDLSIKDFALEHGLSPHTLYWWRRELRLRDDGRQAPGTRSPFVEVELAQPTSPPASLIEIRIADIRILVPAGVAADDLRLVLEAVRGSC